MGALGGAGGGARAPDPARERAVGAQLPYARHVNDHVVALRDGSLMLGLRLDGLLFETADTAELNHRATLRDAMLRAVGDGRHALYHHVLRRRLPPVSAREADFVPGFARDLDAMWVARLAARAMYGNSLFLTLIRRPERAPWWRGAAGDGAARAAARMAALRGIEAAGDQLLAALAPYGARMLEVYDTPHGPCSEVMEMLGALVNGAGQPMRLPLGDMGDALAWRRISFGADTVEWGAGGGEGRRFAAMVSIKDYPAETSPGMLDALLRLPCEMAVTQSFAFVDRADSLSRMDLALRRMRAADDAAISLRGELTAAKDAVAAGRAAYGEHHLTVRVEGDSPAQVDAHVAQVQAGLADLGLVSVREDLGLEAAFWAQFPGNFGHIARRALVGTANFAALASGHNFAVGRATGNLWGDAVTTFETTAAGPYHFNFHAGDGAGGDLGNFTVIGPSGSGKTVIVNFLLAQAQRFAPRTVFFDKDRGGELFIRAIGGRYMVLRHGMSSGLNPLLLDDTPGNRAFLGEWLRLLAGGGLSVAEQAQLREAVEANYAAPLHLRRLSHFVGLLRGGHRPHGDDLYARLRPWCGTGEHAWLFDNPPLAGGGDAADLAQRTVGFDMTALLDDARLRTPAMLYLFHRVDERLDGDPAIIVVDEGWKALDDDVFVARIRDWEKTIRKRGGIVGLVTQNAADALESRIASAIVEQTATQVFTPNPRARAGDYMDGFGLSAQEFALVRSLPADSRCFLVKHGRDSVVARLDLGGEEGVLTVLSGRERTVRLLDEIRARSGDDPADWLPQLLQVA
ncbi:VirB4 family type IV secretion/conjugal transfer ATPase [Novosphingobium sp. FSY-8]|uniref:VirB4 family type IV secretion/conjugal transfer ATPase n=1 Tax=Novosphingobium ovatum TaxID=1908523 RepID=A0ABW9XAR1_9SPHN|nr:VirB4 family type IV secretion/conjugal transfer ATPase [Novosphingobium ovatum]NBC35631.1 VirB4 family type IV secretion/conjugal transfer ATPase [Novosphingobium ovatum]